MKRTLFIHIFCAFALFFLLLTGENAMLSQQTAQQDPNASERIDEYLVSQHQLKAISIVKEVNLRETNLTRPFLGVANVLLPSNLWDYIKNYHRLLNETSFVPDKRKAISLLLYPFHYFW